jgi:hypothetical protein
MAWEIYELPPWCATYINRIKQAIEQNHKPAVMRATMQDFIRAFNNGTTAFPNSSVCTDLVNPALRLVKEKIALTSRVLIIS